MLPKTKTVGRKADNPTGSQGVPTSGFRLIDLTLGRMVALDVMSVLEPDKCPRADDWPVDRVCIPLAGQEVMNDASRYVLLIDQLAVYDAHAETILKEQQIAIPPIGGAVAGYGAVARDVQVVHSLDFTGVANIQIRFTVNGNPARVVSPPATAGRPRCYRPASLVFRCTLDQAVHPGDVVEAAFVSGDAPSAPLPAFGSIKPLTIKSPKNAASLDTKDPTTDASIYIKAGYVKNSGQSNGSFEILIQHARLAHFRSPLGSLTGDLRPYVAALVTTDTTSPGYFHGGIETSAHLSAKHPFPVQTLSLFVTPRVESDKKATVSNFLPLDAEIRLGIRQLLSGGLPGRGSYSILPSGGVEIGNTFRGKDAARPETNSVLRFKGGITAAAQWQPDTLSLHTVLGVPFAGFRIDISGRRYWLRHTVAGAERRFETGAIAATYKLSPHVGISVTARDGRVPPLFKLQRTLDVGTVLVF